MPPKVATRPSETVLPSQGRLRIRTLLPSHPRSGLGRSLRRRIQTWLPILLRPSYLAKAAYAFQSDGLAIAEPIDEPAYAFQSDCLAISESIDEPAYASEAGYQSS